MIEPDTVLHGIGLALGDVVQARVYLPASSRTTRHERRVREPLRRRRRPARTCIGVTALAKGALVEIDFVAAGPSRTAEPA